MFRTMLHSLAAVLLLGLLALPGTAAAQDGKDAYVAGIPDLPLMPGLEELPESGLVFDKPGGRIVEAFAVEAPGHSMTAQSVTAFYDATLPQLGWRREAPGAYLREGERLKLDVSQDGGGITVHFRIFPQ